MKDLKKIIPFLIKILAVGACVAGIVVFLNHRYEKVMDRAYDDTEKFEFIGKAYDDIQICNVGSSHGEYDFNYWGLEEMRGYECFNFALSSQTFNYDYAILSEYEDYLAEDCILFIPISYFSFNDEVVNDKERKNLNTKYYTFLSPENVPDYSLYVDVVTHRLPILSAGEEIRRIFPKLSMKAEAAEGNTPSADEFYHKAQSRYERHMENKENYFLPERIEDLKKILAFCQENGITPVMVTPPYLKLYTDMVMDSFKQEFKAIIQGICDTTGVNYYDYSEDERFRENLTLFSDADHLNNDGAGAFMSAMEQDIPEFRDFLAANPPLNAPAAAPEG